MLTKPSWPVSLQNQFAQEFPFRSRVAGRLDGLHELLHAPFGVGERAALLRMGATGQEVMRQPGRLVRQDVAHDERLQLAEQVRAQAMPGHVFAKNDQGLDAPAANALGNLRQVRAHRLGGNAGEPRAIAVRIPIRIQQQLVAFSHARHRIRQRAQRLRQLRQQVKLLVGLPRRGNHRDRPRRRLLQLLRDLLQYRRPSFRLTSDFGLRTSDFRQPVLASNPLVIQPAVIAHPAGVDRVVLARLVAIDLLLPRPDDDVAARRAARAQALGFLEEPDAHLETEILRGERADRADVHRVQRVIVVEHLPGIGGERVVAAAIHDAERIIARRCLS